MAARLTTAQVRALVDSVYAPISHTHVIGNIIGLQTVLDGKSNTGHTHAFNDIPGLQAALDAKANLNGATFTGALLLPDGTVSAPGIAFSGQTGSGMWRDSNGLQFSHNGTHAFEVRSSGIFFRQSAQPATDNARTMGAFNLRFARMHATHYRATLGSSNGFLFDDGAGNLVNSGIYAVSTTNVRMVLNGTDRLDVTSARSTFSNSVVDQLLSGVSDPTTSDFASGFGGWWSNTTSNEIRYWRNVGGTLFKSAALT